MDARFRLGMPILAALALLGTAHAADRGEKKGKVLPEGEAFSVLLEANAGEVMVGQAGAARLQDPELRDYARRIANDHFQANEQLIDMASGGGTEGGNYIRFQPTSEVRKAGEHARKQVKDLWKEDTENLDEQFLLNTIQEHRDDLDMLDAQISGSGASPMAAQVYSQARDMIQSHLEDACSIAQNFQFSKPDDHDVRDAYEACQGLGTTTTPNTNEEPQQPRSGRSGPSTR